MPATAEDGPKAARNATFLPCTSPKTVPKVLRCRPVRHRPPRLLPAQALTVLLGGLLAISLPASGGADSAPALLQRAQALRSENTALAARSHEALLRLYALDSRLAQARAKLDGLTVRAVRVRAERTLTAKRLGIARRDVATAQAQLAQRLRDLYEQGQTDPLAILLGARSLGAALAERRRDRLLLGWEHRDRPSGRLGSRRRRPERDPARNEDDDSRLRRGRRGRRGLRHLRRCNRLVVPLGRSRERLGAPSRHDHPALARARPPRCVDRSFQTDVRETRTS